jgi:hypothetical protein
MMTALIVGELANREGYAKRGAWLDPSGYDAGKKIKGRKRHTLVDTSGLLLNVVVHPADVAPGTPTVPLHQAHDRGPHRR